MNNQRANRLAVNQLDRVCRLTLFFLLLVCVPAVALGIRRERIADTWRPKHYVVNITLNEQLSEITAAQVQIDIVALKQLSIVDLDFGDLTTDSVRVNNSATAFEHRNSLLTVKLAQPVDSGTNITVTVMYHGKPKDGLILSADKDGKPSAVGDNWPNRVHHWIPSLDHPSAKATVTFNVTAPAREVVVANGKFARVETTAAGSRTWTYSEGVPIPPYCMIIGVGEFALLNSENAALTPLSYYVPRSDSAKTQKGFGSAALALQLFNDTVAPYPYEKLALIIGATQFGGMENSSAIVFTSKLLDLDLKHGFSESARPSIGSSQRFGIPYEVEDVVAHEIAHQWFGDSVTESTWSDLWLSEGFATYFAGLFVQRYEGEEAFQKYLSRAATSAFAYERKTRTPIHDLETEDLFKLLNANNYQKGAWVLHMLRSRLGDDAFFSGIRGYYEAHKSSTANTEDLRAALEKSSGKDLKEFFQRWVYDSGHPQYELSVSWKDREGAAIFILKQVQTGNAFLDPVPLVVITESGKEELTIKPSDAITTKLVKLKSKPTSIQIDPHNTLLKEASVNSLP
jgi:aminopeptidase N